MKPPPDMFQVSLIWIYIQDKVFTPQIFMKYSATLMESNKLKTNISHVNIELQKRQKSLLKNLRIKQAMIADR